MFSVATNQVDSFSQLGRRELLRLGGLTALGLQLPEALRAQAAGGETARKPVNCILLWLLGGPSHIDMYDMKPQAPAEIRGELNPIVTRVPGLELSELMPHMAACADKFSVIRSMHSYSPTHGKGDFHLMSGNRLESSMVPPGFGAMLAWQQERHARQTRDVEYTVRRGDTLSKIAKEQYGDANQYKKIFEANREVIGDPATRCVATGRP